MGHDRGHAAIIFKNRQHVLHEHEVGLFAFFRHHHREAAGKLEIGFAVVLAEGRIGQDPVKTLEFVVLVQMLRFLDGVFLADIGMGYAVQQHVHFADRPGGADFLLAVQ